MQITIPVRGKIIAVKLVSHAVRITTDEELQSLLRKEAKKATVELVTAIQLKYREAFGAELQVSLRSMSVEIWGHVYADQFAQWLQALSRIPLLYKITGKVIERSRLIDIGEKGHDSNRFFWDALSPFFSLIAFFLP